jgi:hypothetical protein
MNDMSAPRRAQQHNDPDVPTYGTIFARTATTFHPAERVLAATSLSSQPALPLVQPRSKQSDATGTAPSSFNRETFVGCSALVQ